MQFAHAVNNGLSGFLVDRGVERGILVGHVFERVHQRILVSGGLRLDGHGDNGFGELDVFEQDRIVFGADGIAGGKEFLTNHAADFAGIEHIDVFAMVCVQPKQTANTLTLLGARIIDVLAFFQLAGIDANEGQFANELIGSHLEYEAGERLKIGDIAEQIGVALGRNSFYSRYVDRGWQVGHHGIQQRLNPFVLKRRSAEYRNHVVGNGRAANGIDERHFGNIGVFHVDFEQLFVHFGDLFDQFRTCGFGASGHVGGYVGIFDLGAVAVLGKNDCAHLDQINHAMERIGSAQRQLDGDGRSRQLVA